MCRPRDTGLQAPATKVRDSKQGRNRLLLLRTLELQVWPPNTVQYKKD